MNVSTPSRSCRASPKPSSQASTPAVTGRKLNMGDEAADSAEPGASAYGVLSNQWRDLEFLLRDGLEAMWDDAAIANTMRTAEEGLRFLGKLEDWANRLQMRKGALSRMLLPFDSETSSGDQATTASQAPLGSRELEGRIPNEERRELVCQAVALRRLVRVKVADCNDVEQARAALRLTTSFLSSLRAKAAEDNRSMVSLLRDL